MIRKLLLMYALRQIPFWIVSFWFDQCLRLHLGCIAWWHLPPLLHDAHDIDLVPMTAMQKKISSILGKSFHVLPNYGLTCIWLDLSIVLRNLLNHVLNQPWWRCTELHVWKYWKPLWGPNLIKICIWAQCCKKKVSGMFVLELYKKLASTMQLFISNVYHWNCISEMLVKLYECWSTYLKKLEKPIAVSC